MMNNMKILNIITTRYNIATATAIAMRFACQHFGRFPCSSARFDNILRSSTGRPFTGQYKTY